jgi:parallel beta-helix repeat protein
VNGNGINVENAHDIKVDHNSFDDVASGLYVQSSTNNIVFDHNTATRIRGPLARGQMVQFNGVHGSGNEVSCNVSDQTIPGYLAGPEDHVNMFSSSGTAASPILIRYNKIRGGGPSNSGAGIIGGDLAGAYVTIDTNILVDSGAVGIAVAGGHDIKLLNNKVYSSIHTWSNIGAYVWDQYNSSCNNIEVSDNRINWQNRVGVANNWWNAGNCGTITKVNNVFGDPTIGPSIWNETFPQCVE